MVTMGIGNSDDCMLLCYGSICFVFSVMILSCNSFSPSGGLKSPILIASQIMESPGAAVKDFNG